MEPRRSKQRVSEPRIGKKLMTRLVVLFLFAVIFTLVALLWEQPANAPVNEEIEDNVQQPIDDTTHASEDTEMLLAAEQERLEQERLEAEAAQAELKRQQLLAFEAEYYGELASTVLSSTWVVMPTDVQQGDIILVRHNEAKELEFGEKVYTLQPFGTGYYTYLPIPANMQPGKYEVGDQTVTVNANTFKTQYLEVTEEMESMRRDTERIRADQIKVDEARSQSAPEFLFRPESEFLQPIEGRLTTQFGQTRYVNGVLSSRHMALDLAAPQGTPIMATNDGIVVLSEELYLAGNSIYIDHGMGLFSQYGHLYELHVEAGDQVKQGDIIGLVGTTGFSTGPHLHFTYWAHNVAVNPDLFFGKTPFDWLTESQ